MINFAITATKYREEFVNLLDQWVSIPSLNDETTATKDMPFWKKVAFSLTLNTKSLILVGVSFLFRLLTSKPQPFFLISIIYIKTLYLKCRIKSEKKGDVKSRPPRHLFDPYN